ncbi:Hypothetical predicted protein [Mytilus galloprovincialis]|uniref:Uncharacterized protein n=1 Tax=Mytilus galloprovincialis TaxID=29158 RepID=A0A8B6G7L0_MYTGA|nr:Hypothetical predicted protein [Mytilus galloprovincialis]
MLTERLYWVGVFKVGRRRRKKERRGEIGRKNARPRKQSGYKGPLEMPKRGGHTSPEQGVEQGCPHRTHSREEEGGTGVSWQRTSQRDYTSKGTDDTPEQLHTKRDWDVGP